ncbi:hypothetical protein NHH03_06995 [Stieleria sp. TO1_6]|uniref:glycosyltransferase family 2 protein n=1 Tax=Stieleria tagensis TaxID=2956795 RepID=UPI00209AD52A|nr:hypothetical protein [Stieleria tagensis]MCO8121477.1 hypothetical protein [Stieleria tagensis]
MPKFPRTPRVSIVIPLQRDDAAFEQTLLSVLENQTEESQVIVAHNGGYTDPFELGEEIDFVIARSSNLIDLVRDAFDATHAPIVHVLGQGKTATADWLTDALDRFETADVAAVDPMIFDDDAQQSVPAGWVDTAGRYCQPYSKAGRRGGPGKPVSGFFINSCFIRRRVLGDLLSAVAPAMNDPVAVSYAFGCLLRQAGWSIATANDSLIHAPGLVSLASPSDAQRGQHLAAIRTRILPGEPGPSFTEMLSTALLGNGSIGEMIGMVRHRSQLAAIRRAVDLDSVASADQLARVLSLPQHNHAPRRAAA